MVWKKRWLAALFLLVLGMLVAGLVYLETRPRALGGLTFLWDSEELANNAVMHSGPWVPLQLRSESLGSLPIQQAQIHVWISTSSDAELEIEVDPPPSQMETEPGTTRTWIAWEYTEMVQGSCLVHNLTLSTPRAHESSFFSDTDVEVKLQAEMKGDNLENLVQNLYLQIPVRGISDHSDK